MHWALGLRWLTKANHQLGRLCGLQLAGHGGGERLGRIDLLGRGQGTVRHEARLAQTLDREAANGWSTRSSSCSFPSGKTGARLSVRSRKGRRRRLVTGTAGGGREGGGKADLPDAGSGRHRGAPGGTWLGQRKRWRRLQVGALVSLEKKMQQQEEGSGGAGGAWRRGRHGGEVRASRAPRPR